MADYGINIGVNVQSGSLTKLTQQLKELRAIEKDLIDIQKSGTVSQKKVSDARRAAKDEINANKKAALDAAKAFNEQTGILTKGTAALREQEKQFRAYRAGAKKAKDGWTTFTQAIVKTNFSAAFGELKALNREAKATAEAFNLMARGGGGVSFARGASIQDLLAFKPANTTNALNAYGNALENVLVDVDRGSEMFRELAARISEVNTQLRQTPVSTTPYSSPIGPEPESRSARFRRRFRNIAQSQRFRDIATGGGFPLLFGGGPIQALAGGIGGGAAGLGGAIAASAIASQVEAFAVSAAQAGQALQSTGGALEFVREKSLFSSKEAASLAAELEEQGKVQELATLLTDELTEVIGTSGLIALQDLGATTDETTKLWNQLTTQLQILISGPLNGFLELVNKILGGINEGLKPTAQQDFVAVRKRILESGTAEQKAQIQAIEAQVRGTVSKNVRGGAFGGGTQTEAGVLTEAGALAGLELAKKAGLMPKVAVTPEDLRTFTPSGRKSRVPQLEIEVGLTERLNTLNRQILEASREEDLVREAALKMEVELEKQAAAIAEIKAGDAPLAEQELEIKKVGLETDQAIFKINHDLKQLKQDQIDKGAGIVEDLQFQLAIAQATNEIEKERLKTQQRMKELQGEGLLEEDLVQIENLLSQIAEENSPLNQFRKQLETLTDPINQTISLANTLGNAFSESFKGIVTGSMSAREALANLFQRTADNFLDMAAQMIAAQLKMQAVKLFMSFFPSPGVPSGFSPSSPDIGGTFGVTPETAGLDFSGAFRGRALGGAVGAGRPYMVGERGPELFVPGAQGNIVPNNAMGGANVTVNVDASGSSVQGDGPSAQQLGKAIGAAVQAELIKQKRPGGLLTR